MCLRLCRDHEIVPPTGELGSLGNYRSNRCPGFCSFPVRLSRLELGGTARSNSGAGKLRGEAATANSGIGTLGGGVTGNPGEGILRGGTATGNPG